MGQLENESEERVEGAATIHPAPSIAAAAAAAAGDGEAPALATALASSLDDSGAPHEASADPGAFSRRQSSISSLPILPEDAILPSTTVGDGSATAAAAAAPAAVANGLPEEYARLLPEWCSVGATVMHDRTGKPATVTALYCPQSSSSSSGAPTGDAGTANRLATFSRETRVSLLLSDGSSRETALDRVSAPTIGAAAVARAVSIDQLPLSERPIIAPPSYAELVNGGFITDISDLGHPNGEAGSNANSGGDDDADVEAGDVSGSGVQGAESTAAAANSGASRRDDGSNSAAAAVEILVDSTLLRPMQAEISSLVSECAPTSRSSESNRTSVPQPATAAAAAAPRGGIAGDSIGDNGGGVSGGAAASASHSRADRLVAHGGWVITVDVDAGKQLGMGMLGASVVQDGSMYGTFVTKTLPSKAAAEAGIQRGDILAALKIHLANPLRDGANLKANLAGWGMTVNESGWTPLLYKKELSAVKVGAACPRTPTVGWVLLRLLLLVKLLLLALFAETVQEGRLCTVVSKALRVFCIFVYTDTRNFNGDGTMMMLITRTFTHAHTHTCPPPNCLHQGPLDKDILAKVTSRFDVRGDERGTTIFPLATFVFSSTSGGCRISAN